MEPRKQPPRTERPNPTFSPEEMETIRRAADKLSRQHGIPVYPTALIRSGAMEKAEAVLSAEG